MQEWPPKTPSFCPLLVPYSKSDELRIAEEPASWTTRLRDIFDDEEAFARQEDITAQEEMRFGERESEGHEPDIGR